MRKNKYQMTALAALIGATMTREAPVGKPMPDFNGKGDLQRALEVSGFDVEKRTVELAFSSEIEAERWFGMEILDHSPESIRLDRLRDGGALLVDHDWTDQIGVVEDVTIGSDRRGRAVVRFGRSARANEIFQDVVDGIRKHVSVGYRVLAAKLVETRDETDVYRITDWEPFEISFVAVPLDHSVGVGRTMEKAQEEQTPAPVQTASVEGGAPAAKINSEEVRKMEKILRDGSGNLVRAMVDEAGKITQILEVLERAGDDVRAAERRATEAANTRSSAILAMGDQYNVRELAAAAAQTYVTVEAFRAQVLDHINTRGAAPVTSARSTPSRSAQTPLTDTASATIGLSDEEVRNYSFFRAIRALQPNASRADREAAAFEMECSEAAQRQMGRTAQGILVPEDVLQSRAFNAGGAANTPAGAQTGSNLVQTQLLAGSFIEMLRNRTTLMRLATTMGGLVGNVDIPKQTGGATAYWLGEGDDTTEGSPSIGQLGLSPKTVGAYTDITRRLLMQSTPDAEALVRKDLANAMAQEIDRAGYYGTGTGNQPRGIKNYTGINAVDFAGLWPTYAEVVAMESEIAADNADVDQMGYVLNARGRGALKTTPKFSSGTDQGVVWEPGSTINGYRSEVTNQLTQGDVFFGNFADVLIGLWGGLDLTVDPYSLSKSGGLRIVAFQDIDLVLRRVESMCYGSQTVTP